jgi:hypothetical protein
MNEKPVDSVRSFSLRDGRLIILLGVLVYLAGMFFLTVSMRVDRVTFMHGLGVPAMEPLFGDTLCVAWWCDGYGRGDDPRAADFKDPTGKKNISMNYPGIFLGLHHMGLTASRINEWGIVLGTAFVAAVLVLAGRCTLIEGALWLLALASPSVVMVIERGNFDILIFVLIVAAFLLRGRQVLSGLLVLFATALKLYPVAALAFLIMKKKSTWSLFLPFFAAAGVIIYFLLGSIGHPGGDLGFVSCCFGSKEMALILAQKTGIHPTWGPLGSQLFALTTLITLTLLGRHKGTKFDQSALGDRALTAFWIGIPVYLLIFLSGDQADYKMIMTLFAIPAVLAWIRLGLKNRWIPKTWLILFLIYDYWLFFSDEGSLRNLLLRQIVAWGFFMITAVMGGFLLPESWKKRVVLKTK